MAVPTTIYGRKTMAEGWDWNDVDDRSPVLVSCTSALFASGELPHKAISASPFPNGAYWARLIQPSCNNGDDHSMADYEVQQTKRKYD